MFLLICFQQMTISATYEYYNNLLIIWTKLSQYKCIEHDINAKECLFDNFLKFSSFLFLLSFFVTLASFLTHRYHGRLHATPTGTFVSRQAHGHSCNPLNLSYNLLYCKILVTFNSISSQLLRNRIRWYVIYNEICLFGSALSFS